MTRLQLARLAEAGVLERVDHGVYASASAPTEHRALRAAWLSLDPARTAEERLADPPGRRRRLPHVGCGPARPGRPARRHTRDHTGGAQADPPQHPAAPQHPHRLGRHPRRRTADHDR
ncbi:hypothetical protein [Cellulomonas denverensis]|uniref:hypothetical protein n=1 Tax=Cellulomonas denverensis TaxID=264297 RepID=UPI0035EEA76F